MEKIDNLTKVTLRLEAGITADRMDLDPDESEFEFIFGIGPDGMCPFEYQIVNRAVGEEIRIHVKKEALQTLFEHLKLPIQNLFEKHAALFLTITILKIEQPENTEVIKALSALASHHHGCDCGCGC